MENLNSKANSIVSDEYSVFDSSAGSETGSIYSNGDATNSMFRVISVCSSSILLFVNHFQHQMPFFDNENFGDITDADL